MATRAEILQKNEKVKRLFWKYIEHSVGYSPLSRKAIEKAICKYEDATEHEDFVLCTSNRAIAFKKYLANNENKRTGKVMGLRTRYHTLRLVAKFFGWLAIQPGYKSRLSPNLATYFCLSLEERRQALSPTQPKYPTLAQVKAMCSFAVTSEIDMRDRALIAFLALTGARDHAVVTLPIGCYNPETHEVNQLRTLGVKTKFSNDIYSTLFQMDTELVSYFTEWYDYLINTKKYGTADPLFPSTEIGQVGPEHRSYEVKGVKREFWADAGPIRKILHDRCLETGTPYFHPHTFRHFCVANVERHLRSPEEMKALSQSIGHKNITTTFQSYGMLPVTRVNELMSQIDFSEKPSDSMEKLAEMVAEKLSVKMGTK